MYNLQKNNYHQKPKSSIVYTPKEVSEFIFKLLKDKVNKRGIILDPCCGQGSLLSPWVSNGHRWIYGIDLKGKKDGNWADLVRDFLTWDGQTPSGYPVRPQLVLCNPPFNGYGNKLGSEVWLAKIIELFGKEIPLVLFTPMGFRLNSKKSGKRWAKFTKQEYPAISSIISLPRDIFAGVEFHSEILIFNIPDLQPHYFFNHHETRKSSIRF